MTGLAPSWSRLVRRITNALDKVNYTIPVVASLCKSKRLSLGRTVCAFVVRVALFKLGSMKAIDATSRLRLQSDCYLHGLTDVQASKAGFNRHPRRATLLENLRFRKGGRSFADIHSRRHRRRRLGLLGSKHFGLNIVANSSPVRALASTQLLKNFSTKEEITCFIDIDHAVDAESVYKESSTDGGSLSAADGGTSW